MMCRSERFPGISPPMEEGRDPGINWRQKRTPGNEETFTTWDPPLRVSSPKMSSTQSRVVSLLLVGEMLVKCSFLGGYS